MMSVIPLAAFAFSVCVVSLSLVPVVFPVMMTYTDDLERMGLERTGPGIYTPGVMAAPVLAAGGAAIGLSILHSAGRLPAAVGAAAGRLSGYDISYRTSLAAMGAVLIIYAAASAHELYEAESWGDYGAVRDRLDSWSAHTALESFEPHVRYFLIKASEDVFGNQKAVPFMASIALLITTYAFARRITGSNLAGMVALAIVLQSNVFLTYDTSVSYTNFWVLFYLASLYCAYRFWPLSPAAYVLSIPSKIITVLFVPMTVYFVLRSGLPGRTRLAVTICMVGIMAVGIAVVTGSAHATEIEIDGFDAREFRAGFAAFSNQMRLDVLVTVFLLPLTAALYMASRRGVRHAETSMVLMAGMLLIFPIVSGFTNQTNHPYRFLPLVVFFAIGVSVLLTKRPVIRGV